MAWQQPKTNWDTHPKAIEPADLNRIEGNIEAVREQSNMALRLETVSSFPAHTPGRVIYHTGNKRAYVSDGAQWISIGVEGDAVAANVLAGKKFSSLTAGVGVTGTMPNRTGHVTAQGSSISGTTLRFRPQPGYYPGDAGNSVQLSDADFIAANIRNGKNIFGVTGKLRKEPLRLWGRGGKDEVAWEVGMTAGNGGSVTTPTLLGTSKYLSILSNPGTGSEVSYVISSPIDVTDYNKLKILWSTAGGGGGKYVVLSANKAWGYNIYAARYATSSMFDFQFNEVDVSGLSGNHYIRVHGVTTAGGNAPIAILYLALEQN